MDPRKTVLADLWIPVFELISVCIKRIYIFFVFRIVFVREVFGECLVKEQLIALTCVAEELLGFRGHDR